MTLRETESTSSSDSKLPTGAPAPPPLDLDSIKFLEMLLSECRGTGDHNWRKCQRCLAVSQLESRGKLAVKFIRHAIERLRAAAAPASPRHEKEHDENPNQVAR